ALHMCVETLFWFHPLVWWIGARLIAERERDCDEGVLQQGADPSDYAHGLLNVCRCYAESPLACTSGVTSAELKQRIREIMTPRRSLPMTFVRKAALALAGLVAIVAPLMIGVVRAQVEPRFEVASIKPAAPREGPDGGGFFGGPGTNSPGLFRPANVT